VKKTRKAVPPPPSNTMLKLIKAIECKAGSKGLFFIAEIISQALKDPNLVHLSHAAVRSQV
jgi:hypothetical protein